ncbi:MAG: DUF2232 domain-containing protein [Alphaproteobacteria bacterium]|nr:DUF2232 domain-containing protein [Alphaproteobacteria bacterium]
MPRDVLLTLAGGLASGLFYAAIGIGSPGALIFAYLAQLPLFLVGLGLGAASVSIAGAVGSLVVLASSSVIAAVLYVVIAAAPVWLLVSRALQSQPTPAGGTAWYPAGHLLAWMAAIGVALLAFAAIWFLDEDGGMVQAARDYLRATLAALAPSSERGQVERVAGAVAGFFPAAIVLSWTIMIAVNGVLAQGALVRFGRAIRPSARMADLDLPRWTGAVLAAALLGAFVPGQIGDLAQNASIILLLPFFFLGLAVIHAISQRWPGRAFIFGLLYLIILLVGTPAILVAGVGIIEQWAQLRRRFAKPPPARENE